MRKLLLPLLAAISLAACSSPAAQGLQTQNANGYAVAVFEYDHGKVVNGKMIGHTEKLSICRAVADKIEREFLSDDAVPNGLGVAFVCVPVPPAPPEKGDLQARN